MCGLFKTSLSVKGGIALPVMKPEKPENVVSDLRNDVNSGEDFLPLVVTANILAAAMAVFGDAEFE